ncbi:MAG: hypothetical protein RR614_07320 [Eubacterium sp.]
MEIFKRLHCVDEQEQRDMFLVEELVAFERYCRDQSIWVEMKKCFREDATVNISWFKGSGWGFVEASQVMNHFAPHKINNIITRCRGSKAVAECITSIQIRQEIDGQMYDLTSYVRLHYRLVKDKSIWSVFSMEAIYEKDTLQPAYFTETPKPLCLDLSKYRVSYAGLSAIFDAMGQPVHNDLPGVDKPELVEALYAKSEAWFEQ